MKKTPRFHAVATTLLATSLFSACGGGSEGVPIDGNACQVLSSTGGSVTVGSGVAGDPALPEAASGYRTGLKPVLARNIMVTTSNAFASAAGCAVLKKGGTAADAAVAVQAVLGLTVPEATGLGSGGFLLYYSRQKGTVQAYDARESAPAAATANDLRWIDDSNRITPVPSASASGRSIGTIGIPRLLEAIHKEHGQLAWSGLFNDAIALSNSGFKIGGRLAAAIASNATSLKRDPEAAAYFLNADGSPKALGTVLANPAYAKTLGAMAASGAGVMYSGQIAADIVAKIGSTTA
ncbi:MAG: gamma-glutamyltransferase, partial [Rhodoferax sp.]|nr:gamma-glutamyltransferase [Rhodoferax sp.]